MSHIRIAHTHNQTHELARQHAEQVAAELAAEFGIESQWEGDVLHFMRSGVEGHLMLNPGEVIIEARLGFLILPLKGRIEQEITRFLDQYFGQ